MSPVIYADVDRPGCSLASRRGDAPAAGAAVDRRAAAHDPRTPVADRAAWGQ